MLEATSIILRVFSSSGSTGMTAGFASFLLPNKPISISKNETMSENWTNGFTTITARIQFPVRVSLRHIRLDTDGTVHPSHFFIRSHPFHPFSAMASGIHPIASTPPHNTSQHDEKANKLGRSRIKKAGRFSHFFQLPKNNSKVIKKGLKWMQKRSSW